MNHKTEAINLKVTKFGEADKLLTLFSKDLGKIKLIAKGAQKTGSKFGGRLEILAYNDLLLAEGKEIYILSEVSTIETFHKIRENPVTLKAGIYLAKVIEASTEIGQKNEGLFDLILRSLYLLQDGISPALLKKIFEVKLMVSEGFFPVLDRCVKCGKIKKGEPAKVSFSIPLGGIICSSCFKRGLSALSLSAGALKTLEEIKEAEGEELKELELSKEVLKTLDQILKFYISEHIGTDIRKFGDCP